VDKSVLGSGLVDFPLLLAALLVSGKISSASLMTVFHNQFYSGFLLPGACYGCDGCFCQ
jgi:hypothetical protein